jgi:transcriptional regulator with GAF, ATPase, and Fis domain
MSHLEYTFSIRSLIASRKECLGDLRHLVGRPGAVRDAETALLGTVVMADGTSSWEELLSTLTECKNSGLRTLLVWVDEKLPGLYKTWELLGAGAEDIIQWSDGGQAAAQVSGRIQRWNHIEAQMSSPFIRENMAGSSPSWRAVVRNMVEIAIFSQSPVVILGESGTGKEQLARLIHHFDIRPHKENLVLLDCSTVVPELSGSEFFGHDKGSFTHAFNTREGAFSAADNGTLFLDEIGELPLTIQSELLRVVQEGTYKRVGSNDWKKTRFRLVSATNRNLQDDIDANRFRKDFFYRISTWIIKPPPLRERREDIPDLVNFFLKEMIPDPKKRPVLDPSLMAHLMIRDYEGNVRELRQVVSRMVGRYTGSGILGLGDLSEYDRITIEAMESQYFNSPGFIQCLRGYLHHGEGLKDIINQISRIVKDIAIREAGGNLQHAAKILQVTDRALQLHKASCQRQS